MGRHPTLETMSRAGIAYLHSTMYAKRQPVPFAVFAAFLSFVISRRPYS
jgi:hypothetical protein